jgi:hypothetical protein
MHKFNPFDDYPIWLSWLTLLKIQEESHARYTQPYDC